MASGPVVQGNLMQAAQLIKKASEQGADMVVLPESFAIMGENEAQRVDIAEEAGHGIIQDTLSQLADNFSIWIVSGTIPLKTETANKSTASSLMFNAEGQQVARYDKIHLFDVVLNEGDETYNESETTTSGSKIVVVDTPFGKVGMTIGYDLRFPKLYRELIEQGAEILLIPSAFTELTGKAHWEPLLRARAIENLSYVIAPAQGGYHVNGKTTHGNSMMIDFWGKIQDRSSKGANVIMIEINLHTQRQVRKNFPVLKHKKL
ncbi:MAG: carbon-nitrogen hydrolase family protein [Cocleimonas sp.]|nr:carbon-nitrogen hydrolase family protein [Cocleimonas sp.]